MVEGCNHNFRRYRCVNGAKRSLGAKRFPMALNIENVVSAKTNAWMCST